jgi:5-methylcytosine-specific restriction protein A
MRSARCDHCGYVAGARAPDTRASAARRGYNYRWRKLRAATLAAEAGEHAGPLCVECLRQGIITPATDLDHIVPKRVGGADTPENLQPLCHRCHSRKTAAGG